MTSYFSHQDTFPGFKPYRGGNVSLGRGQYAQIRGVYYTAEFRKGQQYRSPDGEIFHEDRDRVQIGTIGWGNQPTWTLPEWRVGRPQSEIEALLATLTQDDEAAARAAGLI
jgi:hypothetical protein